MSHRQSTMARVAHIESVPTDPPARPSRAGEAAPMDLEPDDIRAIILRMKRANGHLASVIRMMEEGSDCESVLTQLAAVNKALSRSGYAIVATGLRASSPTATASTAST